MSLTISPKSDYKPLLDLWGPGPEASYENIPALEQYAEFYKELKSIILSHGLEGQFEAYLLHRHYELEDKEVLVDVPGPNEGEWTIRPASYDEVAAEGLLPVVYQFTSPLEALTVMYADKRYVDPPTEEEIQALTEVASLVHKYKLWNDVGISIVHRDRGQAMPTIYREGASKIPRHQVSRISSPADLPENAVATHLRIVDGEWAATGNCCGHEHG